MSNYINVKKLTTTGILALLIAGTIPIKPGKTNSNLSDFPFYRAADNPTTFHTTTYEVDGEDLTGVDAFQQFSNTERNALDLDAVEARELDLTKLKLTYDYDAKVYFINEGAGYRNQLRLNSTGTTNINGMVFKDVSCRSAEPGCGLGSSISEAEALKLGDYISVGNLKAGTNLDFEVLKNGYGNSNPTVWYVDKNKNIDDLQHVIAYEYEGYLILAWEDLHGGGDRDYNDVVFAIDIGENNLNKIPTVNNEPPDADDDNITTDEDTSTVFAVLDNDSDPDNDDLTIVQLNGSSIGVDQEITIGSGALLTLNSDGTFAYDPNGAFEFLNDDESNTDTFTYTVDDSNGNQETATVNITINGISDVDQEQEGLLVPKLWGVDEDDGQLFSFEDYTVLGGFQDYGNLKWNHNGSISEIGEDIEAMTLDEDGTMYMALDRILPGVDSNGGKYCSTLLSFNILDAKLKGEGDNIVDVLGAIGIHCNQNGDNISGLSINPTNGDLVALMKKKGGSHKDRLYLINKADGEEIGYIGEIEGLSQHSKRAEDIEHSPSGSLYVTDDEDDHLYKIDSSTGEIIDAIDTNQKDGLDTNEVKFEALGWDFVNNRLIGNDDNNEIIAKLTLEEGNNYSYGDTSELGLTDVEGIDFVPTADGKPIVPDDTDGDLIPDDDEEIGDPDGDGIPNIPTNNPNDPNNNPNNPSDVDDDGIPNSEDPDSDNDGLPDDIDPDPYIYTIID